MALIAGRYDARLSVCDRESRLLFFSGTQPVGGADDQWPIISQTTHRPVVRE